MTRKQKKQTKDSTVFCNPEWGKLCKNLQVKYKCVITIVLMNSMNWTPSSQGW